MKSESVKITYQKGQWEIALVSIGLEWSTHFEPWPRGAHSAPPVARRDLSSAHGFSLLQHVFAFDEAFGASCSNQDVYEGTARPLVQHVIQGYVFQEADQGRRDGPGSG